MADQASIRHQIAATRRRIEQILGAAAYRVDVRARASDALSNAAQNGRGMMEVVEMAAARIGRGPEGRVSTSHVAGVTRGEEWSSRRRRTEAEGTAAGRAQGSIAPR